MRHLFATATLLLLACPPTPRPVTPEPPARCQVSLDELGHFSKLGTGARATVIESNAAFIGGPAATARVGDVLLGNDKVRVVIQQAGRTIGPLPFGGAIIDADVNRAGGGSDALGKLMLMNAFGRSANVDKVEVLEDGARGGYAVVAATGRDALIDTVNVRGETFAASTLRVDPRAALPLLITTYFVLSPGETRVRVLTAFCNEGRETISTSVGELVDRGSLELFNPRSCSGGMGREGCGIDPAPWLGLQSDTVAYGYRSYDLRDRRTLTTNALLPVAGLFALLADGRDQAGVSSWTQATGTPTGTFVIQPAEPRLFLRDLFIDTDLARVQAAMLALDSPGKSRLDVTVVDASGAPAARARIAVVIAETGQQLTTAIADPMGRARFDVPVGNYRVSTGRPGIALENPVDVAAPANGETAVTVREGASRVLTVTVKDPFDRPLPARVVVTCLSGICATERLRLKPWFDLEPLPSNVQAVAFVPASGTVQLEVPPGAYEVFVTHGPAFSAFPDSAPIRGRAVDLSAGNQAITATLAKVIDTSGWVSADLQVHSVGFDSRVAATDRVTSLAAQGLDLAVSGDHDLVTDFAPLGRSGLTTFTGVEVSPFDFGHVQAFPATKAVDWAGGDGPTLRFDQLFASIREQNPGALVQLNHPRAGRRGALGPLGVDTARGTSAAMPSTFEMEAHPNATPDDTKLFSMGFDAMEVISGTAAVNFAAANDWLTFLSRGWLGAATASSDTHHLHRTTAGLARTWVFLGTNPLTAEHLTTAIKQRRVTGSSGPFITLSARRADGTGPTAAIGDTLSVPANTAVELVVDLQAPEWIQFDAIELLTHTEGRDARAGMQNAEWPMSRVLERRALPVGSLPVEAVPGLNGFAARRVHAIERFQITPATDTWFVVMVRSGSAVRPLSPLVWNDVTCANDLCRATDDRAEAFTNAVLIDADGSGQYDRFPLTP